MASRIAACQFEPTLGDVRSNLERMRDLADRLPADVELAVFPELCVTGYSLSNAPTYASAVPGPTIDSLAKIADDAGCYIIAGLPERTADVLFNTTVVVSANGLEATYRKQYPWGAEASVFTAGEEPVTVKTPVGRVGLCCCYDLNFPELALEYARRECNILAVNAAWRSSFLDDWRLLSRARARDGVYYVLGANQTGDQEGREHNGHSLITGPDGTIRAEAGSIASVVTTPVLDATLERERKHNPVRQARMDRGDW